MQMGKLRWLVLAAGAMVLAVVPVATATQSDRWVGQVYLSLTVVDAAGKPVPQFEVMLHSQQEGYIPWQAGKDGSIRFGSPGAPSLVLRDDPQIQVIVRTPDLAPAILHRTYARPVKETVVLTPGRRIDLFVRTADDRGIPMWVTPLVVYRDFASRVRLHRMPQNQRAGVVDDFEMSKVHRVAEGHYQFRVPTKAAPFLVAIDAPGFMRSIETNYFDENDLADSKIEWEIPAATRLRLQFDAGPTASLPAYESGSIDVAWQIPEEAKYITLSQQQNKGSAFDTTLNDLPPGHYRAILWLIPPQAPKTAPQRYLDDVPFDLAGGEEKTLKLTYVPFDPDAWRGSATLEVTVKENGGKSAAGQPFSFSYDDPHHGWIPVKEGVLDDQGRFQLAKVRPGPNGPKFVLQIGKEWLRRIQLTEPGDPRFEFTLAPEVNDIAPDVTFTDGKDNKPVTLHSFRGHIVYLEFWATWCGPCQIPMTQLNEMMRKRPSSWDGRVDVLAASIDDSPEVLKRHAENKGWNHVRILWAGAEGHTDSDSPAAQPFGVNGIPCAFLIDPEGRIVWKGHPKDANVETQIDELLRAADKPSDKTK
jgi:thiol-disulfide isomerase/thioredoxin